MRGFGAMFLNQIYRHARDYPDSLAVVDSGIEVTYRDFARFIDAVRSLLMKSELPPDGIIVNLSNNLFGDWVLLLALRSLGHTTVSTTSCESLKGLGLRDIGALVCFARQTKAMEAFARAYPECPILEIPRPLATNLKDGATPEPVDDGRFGDHILYTSGTTGTYKKVRYSGDLLESCVADPLTGPSARLITKDDVYHATSFAPWTKAGYIHPLVCWYRGATVIFEQRGNWVEHFFDYPVTMTTFVPPMLERFCRSGVSQPPEYPKFRLLAGAGFIDAKLAMKAISQFACEFLVVYGGTEMRITLESAVQSEEDVIWLTPNFDPDVEVVDEDDQPTPDGEEGILRIKLSPAYPTEYIDDPESTAEHFRDGYFYPGDMAVRRGDGRIRILGRVADVLNLRGAKRAIAPLEDWARDILQVTDLCMFVQQTNDGKEMLIVAIEGSELPDRARLEAVAKRFRRVPMILFPLINKFPRSENGMMKVNRHEVLRLVRESRGPQELPIVA